MGLRSWGHQLECLVVRLVVRLMVVVRLGGRHMFVFDMFDMFMFRKRSG